MFVCLCVFIGCIDSYPSFSITSEYRFSVGLGCIHNMLLLWSLDTFCLLLSGWGDPPPFTSNPLSFSSSSLSSFLSSSSPSFSLLPPLFPGLRQRTCDDRGVSTGHGDPLLPFCSHWPGSRYIPSRSRSPSICSLCSQVHIPAHQELPLSSLTGVLLHCTIVGEKPVWMFLSLILHLFFQSSRLVTECVSVSRFLSFYLLICSPFLVSVCASLSHAPFSVSIPSRPD